jgi:membrane protease YdiL (CAAX protease family)
MLTISSQNKPLLWYIAPFAPYLTVGIGLQVLHNVWAAIFSYHLAMLLIMFVSWKGLPISRLCKGGDRLRLPLLTLAGAGGGILLWLFQPWVLVNGELAAFTQSVGLTKQSWPFFIVYFVLFTPALEELYWRSYLGNSNIKPQVNDFLFSGYHLIVLAGIIHISWLIFIFFLLAAAAWCWRQSNRLGGGLLSSLTSHLAADISVILAAYFLIIH